MQNLLHGRGFQSMNLSARQVALYLILMVLASLFMIWLVGITIKTIAPRSGPPAPAHVEISVPKD
jgi:hypothetical protein